MDKSNEREICVCLTRADISALLSGADTRTLAAARLKLRDARDADRKQEADKSEGLHSTHIVLAWDGEWWTVSDEGGEFARATEPEQVLNYVLDLMHGPPTHMGPAATLLDQLARKHGRTEPLR